MAQDQIVPIHLITKHFQHHSAYSGYDRLLGYLPQKQLQKSFLSSLFSKYYKNVLLENSGLNKYGYEQSELNAELDILFRFSFHKNVYHFLYGENCFSYSGNFNRFNKILLATYHQPESWFNALSSDDYDFFVSKFRLLDGIIAVSSGQAEFFSRYNDNVFYVPHGIDTDFFSPLQLEQRNNDVCVFVGNWLRDFETLKEVCRLLKKNNARIKIKIVTSASNRSYFDGLEVEFSCNISDENLRDIYREAAIVMLPLKDCTANNAALEAIACGVPVVTTDIGGIRDYLSDDCAIFCEPGNPEEMAKEVERLLGDAEKMQAMGSAARNRAIQKFAWPIIAKQMRLVYGEF